MKSSILGLFAAMVFTASGAYAAGDAPSANGQATGTACAVGATFDGNRLAAPTGTSIDRLLRVAANDVFDPSTSAAASSSKGRDGAACSGNDECQSDVCEGGSCCTDYGASCDESSHCCGHQSCTNGFCPN